MLYNNLTTEDINELISICGKQNVFVGSAIHEDLSHDEMTLYGTRYPDAAVEARTSEEVSEVMKLASRRHIPVTPRGSGTGLCGGAVALQGGILLSLAKMDRILEFDETNFTVTVEPGVLLMTLQEECTSRGLMYPPDPGEKSATIGGNVMTNAGGMRAIKYGVTRDYVLGMTIVLPDGTITEVGGKILKNSSGYSIKDLLIGSEGTLAVVTKIILKLIPQPARSLSLLVPFNDMTVCLRTVPEILKARTFPTAVEFMQRQVIEAAEEYLGLKFPDKSANAYLLLTFDGNSDRELEEVFQRAADVCLEFGAEDVFISDTEERQTSIWKARGAFLEAIKTSTTEMDECDIVVPRAALPEYIDFVSRLEKEKGLRLRSFGHAGDGNLHIYLCKDGLSEDIWNEKCNSVMGTLYAYADEIGGQISGEHGIGHAKIDYLEESVGSRLMEIMSGIKHCFDPAWILNPGKVCKPAKWDGGTLPPSHFTGHKTGGTSEAETSAAASLSSASSSLNS